MTPPDLQSEMLERGLRACILISPLPRILTLIKQNLDRGPPYPPSLQTASPCLYGFKSICQGPSISRPFSVLCFYQQCPLGAQREGGVEEAPTGTLTQEICGCAHVGGHWGLGGLLQRI